MAINNNCKSSYEKQQQWNMLDTLLLEAYKGANIAAEGGLRRYFKYWLVLLVLFLVVIIALFIWCVSGKDESDTNTVHTLVYPKSTNASETTPPTVNTT